MSPLHNEFIEKFNTINFEQIKDHPNILIAANFWDEDRFLAAKTCYKFMRAIDDLIDNYKADHKTIIEDKKPQFETHVNQWINMISERNADQINQELTETFIKFKIPLWPMENFAKSMIYDVYHDGFATVHDFLNYAEGASVAPASIFVHLCGLQRQNGQYINPGFDVKSAATPCAVFSYLVHIIRDFQKDLHHHLFYFADDLIIKNGLTRQELSDIAYGSEVKEGFRKLISEYYTLADQYRQKTCDAIKNIRPLLEPRYQLSLDIIFNLYLMVFERIDIQNGSFSTVELNPTAAEIKQRVYQTILDF
jgi:phytoene/squalene synthetase